MILSVLTIKVSDNYIDYILLKIEKFKRKYYHFFSFIFTD